MIKVYKDNVIRSLEYLADYDFQKKAWFASSGPVVSSFVEDVCQLFDDTGLGDAMKVNQPIFGKEVDKCLQDLHKLVGRIDQKLSPDILLNHPIMQTVREKASQALKLISSLG